MVLLLNLPLLGQIGKLESRFPPSPVSSNFLFIFFFRYEFACLNEVICFNYDLKFDCLVIIDRVNNDYVHLILCQWFGKKMCVGNMLID